ncbi:FBXW7 [Bugula neritina]|uniref:FBXW7 n=1 Tax=Bugula neritina TaxID=10212 RepID=A0A7J7KR71_BUGNE|nr:FBXW7 [Bugula neritina]
MAREEVTHHTAPNSDQEDEGESMELGAQLPAELVVADSLPQVPSSEVDNSLEGRTDIATASSSLGATSVAPVSTVEIPAPCDRLEEMLPQISSSSAPIYPITESLTVDTGHQCCSPNTRRLGPSPISSALGSHGRRMSTIPLSSLCSEHPISHPASSQENTSPDNTLAYKRKSEMIEKELSSPGKRVRGMSDSHLNIQLHSSPSASHYGHFHVSPQTPSRRRSSCKVRPPRNMESWLQTFVLWDSTEKTYALNQLIDRCDTAHVRHIMAVIEPQFQRDFISLLPKELALYVLSFLNPKDLLRAGQTCQYWRMLAEDTLLWKQKCRESGADLGNITLSELLAPKLAVFLSMTL